MLAEAPDGNVQPVLAACLRTHYWPESRMAQPASHEGPQVTQPRWGSRVGEGKPSLLSIPWLSASEKPVHCFPQQTLGVKELTNDNYSFRLVGCKGCSGPFILIAPGEQVLLNIPIIWRS